MRFGDGWLRVVAAMFPIAGLLSACHSSDSVGPSPAVTAASMSCDVARVEGAAFGASCVVRVNSVAVSVAGDAAPAAQTADATVRLALVWTRVQADDVVVEYGKRAAGSTFDLNVDVPSADELTIYPSDDGGTIAPFGFGSFVLYVDQDGDGRLQLGHPGVASPDRVVGISDQWITYQPDQSLFFVDQRSLWPYAGDCVVSPCTFGYSNGLPPQHGPVLVGVQIEVVPPAGPTTASLNGACNTEKEGPDGSVPGSTIDPPCTLLPDAGGGTICDGPRVYFESCDPLSVPCVAPACHGCYVDVAPDAQAPEGVSCPGGPAPAVSSAPL
jgi:hypothetical protein